LVFAHLHEGTYSLRALIALVLAFAVSGCTSGSMNLADIAPTRASAASATTMTRGAVATSNFRVAVTYPRFDDHKPFEWTHKRPHQYAVHGTDVSRYQTEVDWHAARESGISFAFIKATEGGDMLDPMFMRHWRDAAEAGIPRSAYHFFYFCRPAHEQAEWFIRNVPREQNALPHVLDMEWNHLSPTCTTRPPAATVQREMKTFLDMLERHYGKRPIIYTTVDFYEHNRLHEFKGYDWWLRSVAAHPTQRYPGEAYRFWQYTGTGRVPGIPGHADINVFNGSVDDWHRWLAAHTR
jgi:lysozyme